MDLNLQLQIIGEVALAMLLGGLIGLEREAANRPAGFHTHMLVAGAAALFVGLGDVLIAHFSTSKLAPLIRFDPNRIIGAIVTGISFLGAGTIFRRHQSEHIEGLTTAASILLASAVGISIAQHRPAPDGAGARGYGPGAVRAARLAVHRKVAWQQTGV